MPMTRIDRRRFVQLSGAGALAATTGGLAGILATGRAPAYAQGATVHWLRWSDFVPASDQVLKQKIVPQAEKDLGIKVNLEFIDANSIQAKITSSVQAGTGPDVIMVVGTWPQLYTESVADVSDVAEEIGKAQGGFYDLCKTIDVVGGKWIGMPWSVGGGLITFRKSWLAEIGYTDGKFPDTWEKYREAGKKLKGKSRPFGQTAGHTFGDAPGWWYPYLWSWGGKEVEADGKTVVLNSKETVESVKFAVSLWKETMDEGGLAWDDSSNNRAFLSGTVSATNNGASIYLEAKKKPDAYKTEDGKPLFEDILHAPIPKGVAGPFAFPGPNTHLLMNYSKNQKPAKDLLRWLHSKEVYSQWFTSQQGYTDGPTKDWENDPVWKIDPILLPFRDLPKIGRLAGHAGPPNRKAAEVVTKYIMVDMYAKAIQGMPAEESVKWAHGELTKIYA
jgi:multiple sugar transport system substrate-binding protein